MARVSARRLLPIVIGRCVHAAIFEEGGMPLGTRGRGLVRI